MAFANARSVIPDLIGNPCFAGVDPRVKPEDDWLEGPRMTDRQSRHSCDDANLYVIPVLSSLFCHPRSVIPVLSSLFRHPCPVIPILSSPT